MRLVPGGVNWNVRLLDDVQSIVLIGSCRRPEMPWPGEQLRADEVDLVAGRLLEILRGEVRRLTVQLVAVAAVHRCRCRARKCRAPRATAS